MAKHTMRIMIDFDYPFDDIPIGTRKAVAAYLSEVAGDMAVKYIDPRGVKIKRAIIRSSLSNA